MAVRSKRLCITNAIGGSAGALIYTTPAGETALIKRFVVGNKGTSNGVVTLRVGGNDDGFNHCKLTVPTNDCAEADVWYVLPGGASAYVKVTGTAPSVNVSLYGAELEGIAD